MSNEEMLEEEISSENFNHGKIKETDISKEVRTSFLDYSMSVIVARALPDVRDGLKPVHRRVLYAMNDLGITSDKAHKKSARIVGEVIGKYHPHGDSAVYETMVRMAQDFSYRYPLVDGHGNFGSIDGDGAAAMRYTEARMSKISMELIKDINKETVDWMDNYDGEEKEPVVLPCKFPNLLVNGTTGIAVGMATNMAPHNLREAIDATIAIIDNSDISVRELMENYIFGPDFPTGASILGRGEIRKSYETGKGSVIVRGKASISTLKNGKPVITINEIPYGVNKANLVSKIADLARNKVIEGITDLRDESNMNGIKVVIEVRKDSNPEVILNNIYKLTPLQSSFAINNVVLVNGEPKQLGLKDILTHYINHQVDVIERRTRYDLKKAEDRAHILEGFIIALDNLDEVIKTIRESRDVSSAQEELIEKFKLDEIQAKAILDMQFKRLTGLEREKILNEYNELKALILDLKDILANHYRVLEIIKKELIEIKEKYGDDRRTEIISDPGIIDDEELIEREDIIITLTANGYIKRLNADTYKVQNRGGRGKKGLTLNEDDVIEQVISMNTHEYLLLFSNFGKVYRIKGYNVYESSRTSKGIPVINIVNIDKDEYITTIVPLTGNKEDYEYLLFVTKNALIKKTSLKEFDNINKNGKIAIKLNEGDELVKVKVTSGDDEILIASTTGKILKFNESKIRPSSRIAKGVKGMNLRGGEIVGVATSKEGNSVLCVSEFGYGKLSDINDFRLSGRTASGVIGLKITEKTGKLVAMRSVNGNEDILVMSDAGVVIRISLDNIKTVGRNTQGVKFINVDNSFVKRIAVIDKEKEEEVETE